MTESPFIINRLRADNEQADWLMMRLVLVHWALAALLAPLVFSGFYLGLIGGGITSGMAWLGYHFYRGTLVSRAVFTVCLLMFTALFIQQSLGKIETHFHFWITLGILIRYRDLWPILIGTVFILAHHILLNYCQDVGASVLGRLLIVYETGPSWYTTALHTFFVLPSALIFSAIIRQNRQAFIEKERMHEHLEEKVALRTEQLQQSNADLKTTVRQLETTQQQLIQAEKMASFGRLTADVAHELKNPLNFVNNFAELAAEYVDELHESLSAIPNGVSVMEADEVATLLSDIRLNVSKIGEHGRRADGVIRSMMLHAHSASGKRVSVDLNALVEEHVGHAYHSLRAQQPGFDVVLEQTYDPSVGRIEVLDQELGRVIINLLDNAFYAVYHHSRVQPKPYQPTVWIATRRHASFVEIVVRDNGSGIAPHVQREIFEPFFTTKPTGEGLGLGLSLSYEIITHRHQGTLRVESNDGDGAAFTIVLPI